MKKTLKWTGFILLAAAAGLALAVLVTAVVRAQSPITVARRAAIQATPFPNSGPWGYGPGMMGGYMGRRMGVYGNWGWSNPGNQSPLTIDQAVEAAHQYLSAYGNPDPSTGSGQVLALTEVMEFSDNFYAEVEEKSTSVHAFELLVDRYSGAVYPEPGPNMMWNTKYGHMGRMMGGWGSWQSGPMTVSAEQARKYAQQWLDQFLPGTLVAESADAFYGYYTIHVLKDKSISGMLSVNGYTGEVWYHTWHGDFVGMKELEE